LNVSEFTYLLNHPETVNEKRTDELDKIVAEFPYFQSARALRLKGLYNEDSFRYNYALKVTAAFTADRSVLFDFITSGHFTSVDKAAYEQKQEQIQSIEVSGSQEVPERPEVVEMTMDESLRASLDTEFVRADELLPYENTTQTVDFPEDADEIESYNEVPDQHETDNIEIYEPEVEDAENESESQEDASIDKQYAEDGQDITQPEEVESGEPVCDPATRSVLDSIKEAEQYAKSLVVSDVEEVSAEAAADEDAVSDTSEIPEQESPAVENLEIGKPLDFASGEKHSFNEWLQLSKLQPIVREEAASDVPENSSLKLPNDAPDDDSGRQKKNELIDKFIETNPKIPKITSDAKNAGFIFEPSQPDNSYLMTETLARVYLEQRKYDKAIQAYEILILKYPEKNSFFADRILDIRNLQQNNKFQ